MVWVLVCTHPGFKTRCYTCNNLLEAERKAEIIKQLLWNVEVVQVPDTEIAEQLIGVLNETSGTYNSR